MVSKIKRVINNPYILFAKVCDTFPKLFSDETCIRILYRSVFGKFPNLSEPQTYNEKLNWMKLYDRNPLYVELVDKYAVRKHVEAKIGEQYLIPLLGVYDRYEDIDFSILPNEFVIKCNHDSASVKIVKNKADIDHKEFKKFYSEHLKKDFSLQSREWAYHDVPHKIIIEERIKENERGQLKDYKFFCFNGRVEYLFVASDRELGHGQVKFDYFDREFRLLPFRQAAHPNSGIQQDKPTNFELMCDLAEKLSSNLPAVRIDLYNLNGKILFGEYTFYHHGGFVSFVPEKYDYEFGEKINMNSFKK